MIAFGVLKTSIPSVTKTIGTINKVSKKKFNVESFFGWFSIAPILVVSNAESPEHLSVLGTFLTTDLKYFYFMP